MVGRPRHRLLCIAGVVTLALLASSRAGAISSRTLFTPTGAAADDRLGAWVATAGDVNGDGFADLIVGAYLNDAGGVDAGQAYLYYGGPAADATADLTLTGAAAGDFFGASVASAGDVNGDGFADLIAGAEGNDAGGSNAGQAYVYFGGPGADATADLTLTGAATDDHFGFSVASAGDVNGDGFADLIVGAIFNDAGGSMAGQAYVYYGGTAADAIADLTLTGAAAGDFFGHSVASAGDVNGDGFADVIVGAPLNGAGGVEAGRAFVYYGGPAADASADLTLTGAAAIDHFGFSVASAGDMNSDGFSDLIVGGYSNDAGGANAGRAYVYYGGPAVDAIADLTLTGAAAGDELGTSVASAGDVNGDGFADVVVGAEGSDAGGSNAGRAYVYLGGPAADATADLTVTGAAAGDALGYPVAAAGDVDGDGFGDLIVGAYGNDSGGSNAGRAYVTAVYPYQVLSPNGGEQWVAGRPATVRWLGHDVADLAISFDAGASWSTLVSGVGGQEQNEITVIAPTIATSGGRVRLSYSGQPVSRATSDLSDGVFRIALPVPPPAAAHRLQLTPTGVAAGDYLGISVAGAGDVNGDGFDDVVVGAYGNDTEGPEAGRAYVYYGGSSADATADFNLSGASSGDYFGYSVGSAGDVNGDGFADVIVGAFGSNLGTGYANVYYGGPVADATPDLTLTGTATFDNFGYSVGSAGDVNGDGFADLIVGAYGSDAGDFDAGRAYVYFGGPSADAGADLTLTGAASGDWFGISVASAGDMNGDGFADMVVGAYANDAGGSNAGRAYVYFGGPAPDATADLTLTGTAAGDEFASSVAPAGDVNGDGFADLIVGALLSDAAGADAGRAYVYYGGLTPDATADLHLTGAPAIEAFGYSVASAGDMNGDGFSDLIVGAAFNDAGGADAGRAYVYDCNRYFVVSPNDDEQWNVGAAKSVSWLGAERADLWLSTNGGVTYDLLRHDVGGSDVNAVGLLVPHSPTKFARVKVTPVDPSLRGADESDSTFTIQSSVALLSFIAQSGPDGTELSWSTEPGVGPSGLAGYRLFRLGPGERGNGVRVGPELITESRYRDAGGAPGSVYRLTAVNGLMEELELGRVSLAPASALAAWPLPYRGGELSVSFGVNGLFGSATGEATVELFDLSGRHVKTVAGGRFKTGHAIASWDGRDDHGAPVRTGMYFLRATSGGVTSQLKLVVAR